MICFILKRKEIDFKSSIDDVEKVDLLQKRIIQEIFSNFEEKKVSLLNIKKNLSRLLFSKLFSNETVDSVLNKDLSEIRYNRESFYWHDRALVVSGITLGLISLNSIDKPTKTSSIDFIQDREQEVWQRALVGLVLTLYKTSK